MIEIKLKPCPFCGSEDIYKTHSEEIPFGTKNPEIFCNTCKAIFAVEDDSPYLNCDEDFKYRREKTAEAWNKRAERHGHWETYESEKTYADFSFWSVKALSCSECKRLVLNSSDYCPHCGARMDGD